jgi:hypothetical protein
MRASYQLSAISYQMAPDSEGSHKRWLKAERWKLETPS